MLKKVWLPASILLSSAYLNATPATATPKYQISDQDMQAIILKANNAEQCIHPELTGLSPNAAQALYRKSSLAEKKVWQDYVQPKLVAEVIGAANKEILYADQASKDYATAKQKKLNHQRAEINPEECRRFKQEFETQLAFAEKELQARKDMQAEAQQAQRRRKERRKQAKNANKANPPPPIVTQKGYYITESETWLTCTQIKKEYQRFQTLKKQAASPSDIEWLTALKTKLDNACKQTNCECR